MTAAHIHESHQIMNALPAIFISHGSPMHAINAGPAGEIWAAMAQSLPVPPKAVLIATAHWETNLPMLSGSAAPAIAPYALESQAWIYEPLISGDKAALFDYRQQAPHAVRAHPSEEHFLPFFIALGAAGDHPKVERVFAGFEGSALAMDAYRFN